MKQVIEKLKQYPISYILFGIFLIIAYTTIIPIFYFSFFQNIDQNNFWAINLINLSKDLLIALLLIWIFRKSLKKEIISFWKNKKELIKIGFASWGKGILLMVISNILVISITGEIAGNEEQNREIMQLLPLYAIIAMCFIGPFIEELVFRKSFKKAFKNKTAFILFTSLLFASLHVINGFDGNFTLTNILNNWQQLLYLIPYSSLAIFFADAYYKTDNIFTSTFAHCLHNTFSICIILLGNGIL